MKHYISLLLAILLILTLVGCTIPPSVTPPDDTEDPGQSDPTPTKPFLTSEFFTTSQSSLQLSLTTLQEPHWDTRLDVSAHSVYGTGPLFLIPTLLKLEEDGKIPGESILKAPIYKANGKISQYANTVCGTYHEILNTFVASPDFGVRAVGLSSGVTDREKDYKNAVKTAIELSVKAKNSAIVSMTTHGSTLASIVFKKATDPKSIYNQAEINTLKAMVSELLAADGALMYIEQAYMYHILGYVASADVQIGIEAKKEEAAGLWSKIHTLINTEGSTLSDIKAVLTAADVALPSDLESYIAKFEATKANALSAQAKLDAIQTKESYVWDDISSAVLDLANVDTANINGYAATEVMANLDALIQSMMDGGLSIITQSGGGVYADIADHCGNYKTDVTINELYYKGLTLNNIIAVMQVNTSASTTHLAACEAIFDQVEPPIGSNAIEEVRAYVFDLSFRAATPDTKVYLKTGAISSVQSGEPADMPSTMTFSAKGVNAATMQSILGCVRIVFFDTEERTILGKATLDAKNALMTEEGIVAPLAIQESSAPLFELSSDSIAKVSVLVYIDSDAATTAYIPYDAFSSVQSAIQLAFSDAEPQ